MFRNYFKTAYRNLVRHKGFTFINIAGLSLGLTACLLIGLFVYDELQYDRFLPEGEQVYRLYNERIEDTGNEFTPRTPPMYAPTLVQELPEVEQAVRILDIQAKSLVEAAGKKIYQEGGLVADAPFFDIFRLSFVHGAPEQALANPSAVVLSDQLARKLFGAENPLGKELSVNKQHFLVSGVFKTPEKFHLRISYILPMAAAEIPAERMKSWRWQQFHTYVKLKDGADAGSALAKFRSLVKKQIDPVTNRPHNYSPFLQPLREVYLHSASFKMDMARRGNITYVRALSIIAVFILLIACFNFVNLATAKSMQRAKEVGVRKAVGASRAQLMLQFIGETVLLTCISVVFATALTSLLLPSLNAFTGKHMTFDVFSSPAMLLFLLGLTLVVGVLAGFYPALVLSGFQPVKVLKGAVVSESKVGKIQWLRHGLIVVQFAVSIFLIISAIVVFCQVSYLHNKDLGFDKEQIMFFPMRGDNMFAQYETFKNELLQTPGITAVSIGYGFPGDAVAGDGIIVPRNGEQKEHPVTQLMVDFDYLKTLNVQLVAGRAFSRDFKTDADHAFMLNETAVRALGFGTPEQAIGRPLLWDTWDEKNPDSLKTGKVIGVVKDFHYKSLYDIVEPTVLQIYPDAYWKVAVKVRAADMARSVAHVKEVWHRFSPDYPIEYIFMDENFTNMYQAEDKLKSLLWIFTGLAILVACLGLFGLAAYAAERRKKEIGIRKVLGADISNIVALLAKEFLLLILVSALLAFPLAWYAMHEWLQDFAYRIDIPLWGFVAAGLLAALVAFCTISYQAIRAASVNPVLNLRFD